MRFAFVIGYCLLNRIPGLSGQIQGGYATECNAGNCTCYLGFSPHPNGKDCKNNLCLAQDCLNCSSSETCVRCVNFILSGDGSCVNQCSGTAEVRNEGPFLGLVCVPSSEDMTKVIIGVVAGVGSGLILCLLFIFFVCLYLRKTRRNISLHGRHYKSKHIMERGSIKQFPVYDNQGFALGEESGELKTGVVDQAVYSRQLEQLRPHTETLMEILAQVRPKLRAMDEADARVPTYKGVIHQLCRVLVLLHRKESGPSIPSDALGLIGWAHQMLEDHRQQSQEFQHDSSPDILGDTTPARISYIDVEADAFSPQRQTSAVVYAEPCGSFGQSQRSGSGISPYSSVPVPFENQTSPRTFATINRTPSVPGKINTAGNRGYSQSTLGRKSGETAKKTDKSVGYFANGRYYDPTPMPNMEIYAPASSYSDRSMPRLSSFIPDRPQSLSSEGSSNGDNIDGEEDSTEEFDVFPFDPKDATDPVEV